MLAVLQYQAARKKLPELVIRYYSKLFIIILLFRFCVSHKIGLCAMTSLCSTDSQILRFSVFGVCLQRPPRLAEKTRSRSVIGYTSHINYANESRDAIGASYWSNGRTSWLRGFRCNMNIFPII